MTYLYFYSIISADGRALSGSIELESKVKTSAHYSEVAHLITKNAGLSYDDCAMTAFSLLHEGE